MKDPTRSRRPDAIALAMLSLFVSGLAHPTLASSAGYSSYEIFVFVLNGAILSLLLVRSAAGVFHWGRPLFWTAPVTLICFLGAHLAYDTLFYQKFPKLTWLLIMGIGS
ncbi:MAG: hypothetical protein O7H41_11035 [Planctomycetota bacterium]|nr:hypothetical protein [Planctomycetota bacterium]